MIIFTLRRLLLLLITLFFLTFVGFSLSYFTPHAHCRALPCGMRGCSGLKGCCTGISASPALTAS
ncbi:antimicrobial peptide ABC transporter permease SapB [Klebsiella pneumoniae]|uniref:Antimicrobial peptide ABC transporter permease SapB n=1 Tax=Klebsiella pneumoniae TaxID=573 RepID=A0A2X3II09_KLEPN|nr:antimicrobial peptide ABC transporter permease SapB [Klebsiella pneumoniae]